MEGAASPVELMSSSQPISISPPPQKELRRYTCKRKPSAVTFGARQGA